MLPQGTMIFSAEFPRRSGSIFLQHEKIVLFKQKFSSGLILQKNTQAKVRIQTASWGASEASQIPFSPRQQFVRRAAAGVFFCSR